MLQADAYGGYNDLYRADRDAGPVTNALCWSHARRKFFELADIAGNVRKGKPAHQISPVAQEAVKRIDAIFDIAREINGLEADARLAARQELSCPLVDSLHDWLLAEPANLSRHNKGAKAINCMFEKQGRWHAFTAFLDDGRICLTNNAAELGETVDRIFDLAIDMETEDGVIWVNAPGDDSVIAFTPFGIENLRELIEMDRHSAR